MGPPPLHQHPPYQLHLSIPDHHLSGTVNTDGSTSMESVVKALAEAFMEQNPDVTVNYSGTGSGTGIQAAIDGTVDLGLASRALKDEEKSNGAVENIVALDGVAVVVNPENGVTDLTVEQIAQIFTGEITNWSELGGADAEIAVFGREAGSGTRGAFEEIVGVEDACTYTNEYSSTGDVIGNVASTPNGISCLPVRRGRHREGRGGQRDPLRGHREGRLL